MARASAAMAWSFNALLRQHLRDREPIDRDRALLLLHAHFGDRPGAAFGRAALLQTLLGSADSESPSSRPRLRITAEARELLKRACGVRPLYLPEGSEYASALRKTDLALGPDAGLRSVVALAANGARPVLIRLLGLRPEDAASWTQRSNVIKVVLLLGPEELELHELFPLIHGNLGSTRNEGPRARDAATTLEPSGAPLLGIIPQGKLDPSGCRWMSASSGESAVQLVRESLDACSRLIGLPELRAAELKIRAIATGGLALANALRTERELRPSSIEIEDALYRGLADCLAERSRHDGPRIVLDVLPHQAELARSLMARLRPQSAELRETRPVDRARQLMYRTAP